MLYWLDRMKRDSKFPLPAQIRKVLLSEAEVKNAFASGADPVSLSIEKWNHIIKTVELLGLQPLPLSYMHDLVKYIG